MSDSDSDKDGGQQKDPNELAKEIEEKCWEAFLAFDREGSGQITSGDVKFVLEMMGLKVTES